MLLLFIPVSIKFALSKFLSKWLKHIKHIKPYMQIIKHIKPSIKLMVTLVVLSIKNEREIIEESGTGKDLAEARRTIR